jgi:hypothetical protein
LIHAHGPLGVDRPPPGPNQTKKKILKIDFALRVAGPPLRASVWPGGGFDHHLGSVRGGRSHPMALGCGSATPKDQTHFFSNNEFGPSRWPIHPQEPLGWHWPPPWVSWGWPKPLLWPDPPPRAKSFLFFIFLFGLWRCQRSGVRLIHPQGPNLFFFWPLEVAKGVATPPLWP